METILMPVVKIRPKGQITIPSEILQAWHVEFNEQVNVNLVNGVVMLTPIKKNKASIMSYAGIAQGLWGDSADDSDNFIRNERESWET
jgi:bifunctional DNA-binding transcriptional regulator/antitoxin component of YhaV-PrlF toxin-antitoxin module